MNQVNETPISLKDRLITPQFIKIDQDTKRRMASLRVKSIVGQPSVLDTIPYSGVIIDIGCGSGELGVAVAQEKKCALLQADITDMRDTKYRMGDIISLQRNSPTVFDIEMQGVGDAALVVDVLEKVIYGDKSPTQSKITFLKGLLPIIKQDGKILIVSTKIFNSEAIRFLQIDELVKQDELLRDRVNFYI